MRWAYYVKEVVSIRFYTSAMKNVTQVGSRLRILLAHNRGFVLIVVYLQFATISVIYDGGAEIQPPTHKTYSRSTHCRTMRRDTAIKLNFTSLPSEMKM